jgi:hypothetical protein
MSDSGSGKTWKETRGDSPSNSWPEQLFNDYAPPNRQPIPGRVRYFTNDPVVRLSVDFWANRQQVAPDDPARPDVLLKGTSVFSYKDSGVIYNDIWWRYAGLGAFISRESVSDPQEQLISSLGQLPEQPRDQNIRQEQLQKVTDSISDRIWLFNVIVAFEWWPLGAEVERQIHWLCRNASDFLFDVTDGYMALGQIVLGGRELMPFADIQVFASNRLFPRSWVGGMYNRDKYSPIRVGRGLWNKNRNRIIPWDEPEAYRTLIHEWAHYAMGLRDYYLQNDNFSRVVDGKSQTCRLIVPTISAPVESIMSVLEGTSELTPRATPGEKSDWELLKETFEWLQIKTPHRVNQGPNRLALPLPEILSAVSQEDLYMAARLYTPEWAADGTLLFPGAARQPLYPSDQALLLPIWNDKLGAALPEQAAPYISSSHCWIYLLREEPADQSAAADANTAVAPKRKYLIAQGVLEDRPGNEGFALVGAHDNDTVILIGDGYDKKPDGKEMAPIVLTTPLTNLSQIPTTRVWDKASPQIFPLIDVMPTGKRKGSLENYEFAVRLQVSEDNYNAWIFPLGAQDLAGIPVTWNDTPNSSAGTLSDEISKIPSLDGHVLLERSISGKRELTIATYSIGGTPSSAWPVPPNPIAAGSSEGNSMLFFDTGSPATPVDYSNTLVVTTLNHGIAQPSGLAPRSYTFSVATNDQLPAGLAATLVMFYDRRTETAGGDPIIHRRQLDNQWEPMPTFLLSGLSYAAAPLYGANEQRFMVSRDTPPQPPPTAPGLFDEPLHAEHYRLFVKSSVPIAAGLRYNAY